MESESAQDIVWHTILRLIVVACLILGFGLVFFRLNVFSMRLTASQFLTSGVTAAIAYAALQTPRRRDLLAALFVWYIVLVFFVTQYTPWLLALYAAYVAGIAAAVYIYVLFVRKNIVRGTVQRVAAAGVITAVINALIMVILGLFSWRAVTASLGFYASLVFRNLQFGTLIGISFGIGVECAEYAIRWRTAKTG
jgi:hypothetical protein